MRKQGGGGGGGGGGGSSGSGGDGKLVVTLVMAVVVVSWGPDRAVIELIELQQLSISASVKRGKLEVKRRRISNKYTKGKGN